ncbi:MAG: hypothetical protein AAB696_00425 [Patescibacteria group bacterium]
MTPKRFIILILSVIVFGLSYLLISQSYPIAFVNWQPIIFSSFKKDVLSAGSYYQKILETYDKNQAVVMNSKEVKQEIERAVLDKLIEDKLIWRELEKRLENNDLKKMINDKIEEAIKGKDIKKEVEALYGISLNEFKERFLKPQARREIFESRLQLENNLSVGGLDNWLKKIKKQAKVVIFLPGFEWNGEGIIIK